jgi:hypothetical protein
LAKILLIVFILAALWIAMNWNSIKESIIIDDNVSRRRMKEDMFSKSPTKTDTKSPTKTDKRSSCASADGILNRSITEPVLRPQNQHTLWYTIMISIEFLISYKKSIIISIVAVGLYFIMF